MYGISIKAYWANTVRSTVLLLLVVFEEISHFIHGVFKILKLRKINYPEMVRLLPVETAAMNKKYLLFTEKIKHELLVICDVETLCVYLWEDLECRLRLYSRQTVNAVKCVVDILSLIVDTSPRQEQIVSFCVITKSIFDYILARYI